MTYKISDDPTATLTGATIFPVVTPGTPNDNEKTTLTALGAALGALIGTVGVGTLAARPAAGTMGRLYYVTDAATPHLSFDNGSEWLESPITGTYTGTLHGGPITLLDLGSTRIEATVEGSRKALVSLFSTNPESYEDCAMRVENIHKPSAPASFIRTGIDVRSFTPKDNGGESSGIISVSTGGGPAATFYHAPQMRPSGYPDYSDTTQPAVEIATNGYNAAILVTSGATIGGAALGRSAAINVQVDGGIGGGADTCDGIIIQPGDGATYDTRNAWLIGNRQTNAAPINVKAYCLLNGDQLNRRLGLGGSLPGEVSAGQVTSLAVTGYTSLDGIRFKGNDAANTIFQNNLNATLAITTNGGVIVLGAGVSAAHVTINTSGNVGVGTQTFGTNAATVFAIKNGTAPTTGPADTVQFYSSDNSAGNTIPSFYCEGTEVIATGQADSASSVRVKMRVNGTVVTLLAI